MKYNVGQYVMYRNSMVCRVEAIGKLQFLQNSDGTYYTLKPSFTATDEKNYIPTTSEGCLRAVITPDEANTYLDRLAKMDAKPYASNKKQQLASHYQELFSSDDLNERLLLLKEVSMKDKAEREKGKKLAATDEQYKKKIEQVLSEEFAVALERNSGIVESASAALRDGQLVHTIRSSSGALLRIHY